ncbi:hypothetical protein IAT38_006308 [Cryptococcus sp. DSM 104549]
MDAHPEASGSQWPTAPVYSFVDRPSPVASLDARELDSEVDHNFWRSARWCSDGSAVLSTTEDRSPRVHSLVDPSSSTTTFNTATFPQPDAITSILWYPSATPSVPGTFCFVASVRDAPVRLVDAGDGRIRATYPIVDHRERFIAPHSLAFNPTATKLYCGFENAIEVLDVSNPGYDTSERLKTAFTKRTKGGQKGIISALAFASDYSGTFAAGSYSGSVSLYSEDTGAVPMAHLEGVVGGGVTQVAFHPLTPTTLFVASRRSSAIQIFDTRDTSLPVGVLERQGRSNQRLRFDVDPWGRWIAAGDETGTVRIWDINNSTEGPVFEKKLHDDAIGSVQFHPFQPLLLTCAGSRARRGEAFSDASKSDEEDGGERSGSRGETSVRKVESRVADSRLRVWSMVGSIPPAAVELTASGTGESLTTPAHSS